MPDISVQFHALLPELMDFFSKCAVEYGLRVVKITFPPYHAEEVDQSLLAGVFSDSSPVRDVAFTLDAPVLPAKGNMDFCEKNPDALHLSIGRRTAQGVKESHLSARGNSRRALSVWSVIAQKLKKSTTPGAMAINPDTGVSGPAKWHRFTKGARDLEASGVPMLSTTGIVLKPGS